MKRVLSIALMLILFVCPAAAQERKGSALNEWLKVLQQKMTQIVPQKAASPGAGLSDARAQTEDPLFKLYWKGRKADEPVTEEELTELRKALDLAAKGDRAGAVKGLDEFMKRYPDSALVPDAKKTMDLAKVEVSAEKR
jgi:TolA-binding protein